MLKKKGKICEVLKERKEKRRVSQSQEGEKTNKES